MRWLYRLQARAGLTRPEGTAALVILTALLGGTAARHFQAASAPVPADVYAAADAAFATAAADTSESEAAPPASVTPASAPSVPGSPSLDGLAPPSVDSTAAQIADAAVDRAAAPRRSGKPPPAPTNINTASEGELQRLPRVGPALAARIVEHRRVHGPFRRADEITEVKGIGNKTLETLRPWIRL